MLVAEVKLDTDRLNFSKNCCARVAFLDKTSVPILSVARLDSLEILHLVKLLSVTLGFIEANDSRIVFLKKFLKVSFL